jgi:hypothetical protein
VVLDMLAAANIDDSMRTRVIGSIGDGRPPRSGIPFLRSR